MLDLLLLYESNVWEEDVQSEKSSRTLSSCSKASVRVPLKFRVFAEVEFI